MHYAHPQMKDFEVQNFPKGYAVIIDNAKKFANFSDIINFLNVQKCYAVIIDNICDPKFLSQPLSKA